ncbi:septal ring lytic transglycosylase RlpA family protein [Pseudovibrio exalbescens]|uniref:septal ring lytic transglycosylase RlpA family protein n=1 Tax=Pseudovibrio exalbescens TaxID=197461 RepID=UPI0004000A72|nr:septal ring lytic transglycosylase RlpA family protein [Pseudovibrio exalbescens]
MANVCALLRQGRTWLSSTLKITVAVGALALVQPVSPTLASGAAGTAKSAAASAQCGKASWYALTSRTASGEMANPNGMTAAHRTLPFGTMVKVTNLRNGKSVQVRINDRGPFVKGRVIDVTKAAAAKIGFVNSGITSVKVEIVGKGSGKLRGYECS